MHTLLQRQLKRHGLQPESMPPAWQAFIEAVGAAYEQGDADRAMLERSLELTSEELLQKNHDLRHTNDELRDQTQMLENLVIVAQSTTGHATMSETLQSILNVAILLTNSKTGGRNSLFLFDENGRVTLAVLARGQLITKAPDEPIRKFIAGGLTSWVIQHRQAVLIEDTAQDARWLSSAEDAFTARSALCLPILSGSQLLAVLTLTHPEPGHFSQDHAHTLQTAAGQIALALRNAQLNHEQSEQARRQHTLYETLRTVGAYLDPETVIQKAVTAVAELTGWQTLAILLPNESRDRLFVRSTAGKVSLPLGWNLSVQEGIIGRTFRTGQTQYSSDVTEDRDYVLLDASVRSELVVPLRRGERILGVLDIESEQLDGFDAGRIQLAESLAEAVALALDNARLHKELLAAKETAEAANQAKSEFISVASHELKNPMTSIKGYADLLVGGMVGPLNEKQAEFLKTILLNVSRMQTIVSDLTDISQIESGHLSLWVTAVSMSEVTNEVVRSLAGQIQAREQTLSLQIPESLPPIAADRLRLVQIMINLVSNAHKYTPPGGEIIIWAGLSDSANGRQPRDMVHVTVKDNGIGIHPDDQRKLFQKFFRAGDPLARQAPGTGLGLNITKNLVEIHGGRIWFESEPRRGTAFHFTMPVHGPGRR